MTFAPKSQRLFYLAAVAVIILASVMVLTAQKVNQSGLSTSKAQTTTEYNNMYDNYQMQDVENYYEE